MAECSSCLGEGEHDFRHMDVPLEALCREVGLLFEPLGVQTCPHCLGTGEVTEDEARDLRAGAVAAVDQFMAGVRDGRISV